MLIVLLSNFVGEVRRHSHNSVPIELLVIELVTNILFFLHFRSLEKLSHLPLRSSIGKPSELVVAVVIRKLVLSLDTCYRLSIYCLRSYAIDKEEISKHILTSHHRNDHLSHGMDVTDLSGIPTDCSHLSWRPCLPTITLLELQTKIEVAVKDCRHSKSLSTEFVWKNSF